MYHSQLSAVIAKVKLPHPTFTLSQICLRSGGQKVGVLIADNFLPEYIYEVKMGTLTVLCGIYLCGVIECIGQILLYHLFQA